MIKSLTLIKKKRTKIFGKWPIFKKVILILILKSSTNLKKSQNIIFFVPLPLKYSQDKDLDFFAHF